jgi:hypothetical protein
LVRAAAVDFGSPQALLWARLELAGAGCAILGRVDTKVLHNGVHDDVSGLFQEVDVVRRLKGIACVAL